MRLPAEAYDAGVSEGVTTNEFGQPIGRPLPDWQPCPYPDVAVLRGTWCRVEPLSENHLDELYAELCGPDDAPLWTYLPTGPYADKADFLQFVLDAADDTSSMALTVLDPDGRACGTARLMRIDQANGSVEIGWIVLARRLQRTTAATEAFALIARHVFELGYRRYEWKCDSLNEPSRRAAQRLGFRYEGRFRNALVYKGRNRDTDWFALTAEEWPAVAAAYDAWLDPANFVDGIQRQPLRVGPANP